MKFKAIVYAVTCLVIAPSLVIAPGALASSLVNMDAVEYRIMMLVGETTQTVTIGAGQTIDNLCDNCIIQIVGDDSSVFDVYVDETVVIKEGEFSLLDAEDEE